MVYSTLVTLRRKGYQGRSPWLVSREAYRDLNWASRSANCRAALGFILFKRNIETRVKNPLVLELRNFLDKADAPVLIDQEGGRVVRLDRRITRSIRPAQPSATPRWALGDKPPQPHARISE